MIGLLYESGEWSDYKLASELAEAGCSVRMIDLGLGRACDGAEDELVREALACEAFVSRVFASAVFRGHAVAHERMERIALEADRRGIPMLNPPRAHFFEIDKAHAVRELAQAGVAVPRVQALGRPCELMEERFEFPCIIKPNCGGRTTFTALARSSVEAARFLGQAPNMVFVVEDYIEPERGFITRTELVDATCALAVKRSVVEGGLSAYHLGSTYEVYRDLPTSVRTAAQEAGRVLDIAFGSFDIVENGGCAYVIDANSVSNVTPDNTETFEGFDLMREYAQAIARRLGSA